MSLWSLLDVRAFPLFPASRLLLSGHRVAIDIFTKLQVTGFVEALQAVLCVS